MINFQEWQESVLNEALPTMPQGDYVPKSPFMRNLINIKNQFTGKPSVDWEAAEKQQMQQRQQQQMQGTKDDPAVQQAKFQELSRMFLTSFNNLLGKKLNPKGRKLLEPALQNLAKYFTMNVPLRMSDLENVLIAVHQYAPRLDERIRDSKFENHATVLRVLQEIFEHDRRTWYDPQAQNAEDRYPPQSTFNPQELEAASMQWANSGYRFQPKMPVDDTEVDSGDDWENGNRYYNIGDIMQTTYGHQGKRWTFDELVDIADGIAKQLEAEGKKVKYDKNELDKIRMLARARRRPMS